MRMKSILLFVLTVFLMAGCMKEDLDFTKFSKTIEIEREQALPLVKGDLSFEDIAGHSYDSLEVNVVPGVDSIFLYLLDNVNFHDTIKMGDIGSNIDIEFIKLYHTFTNDFPIGLDLKIYLYDSAKAAIIDSIPLNKDPNSVFLQPALVDANGLVDTSSVETMQDYVDLSSDLADKLLHQATHVILNAKIPTGGNYIKVLNYYALSFKFGIDAKGKYKGQL